MNKKGTTLIEVILYVTGAGVVLLSSVFLLFSISSSQLESEAISNVEQQGAIIFQKLTQDIRSAISISSPSFASSDDQLRLINSSSIVNYYASSNILYSDRSGSDLALHNSEIEISNLNFENIDNSIEVSFTLTTRATEINEGYYSQNFRFSAWPGY